MRPSLHFITLAALATRAAADGSREPSPHDATLKSLCPNGFDDTGMKKRLPPPVLEQQSFLGVRIRTSSKPLAIYVTDADDTIIALASNSANVTLNMPAEAMEQPQKLVPHAVVPIGFNPTGRICVDVRGEGVENWRASVDNFNYEGAMGHDIHATHDLPEALLTSVVPQLTVADDGKRATVTMRQHPSLYVPLVYLKCSTTNIVGFHRFARAAWPNTRGPDFRLTMDGWNADGACTRLQACAAMPSQVSCGGFPQRCAEVDLLPALVSRIEAKGVVNGGSAFRVTATLARGRLTVHDASGGPPCEGMRLYLKDGSTSSAAILAFSDGDVQYALTPEANRSTAAAGAPPRMVWAYRACGVVGGGPATQAVLRSEAIHLAKLVADAEHEAEREAARLSLRRPEGVGILTDTGSVALLPPPLGIEGHPSKLHHGVGRPPLVPVWLRALAGGALGLATLAVVAGALRGGGWRRAAIGHHEYHVAAKVDDV